LMLHSFIGCTSISLITCLSAACLPACLPACVPVCSLLSSITCLPGHLIQERWVDGWMDVDKHARTHERTNTPFNQSPHTWFAFARLTAREQMGQRSLGVCHVTPSLSRYLPLSLCLYLIVLCAVSWRLLVRPAPPPSHSMAVCWIALHCIACLCACWC